MRTSGPHFMALTVSKEFTLTEAGNSARVNREFWFVLVRTPCYYAFFAYTA